MHRSKVTAKNIVNSLDVDAKDAMKALFYHIAYDLHVNHLDILLDRRFHPTT